MGECAAHHPLAPPVLNDSWRGLLAGSFEAIKRTRSHVKKELSPVFSQCFAEAVEHFDRCAARVLLGLDHERGNSGDQHGLGYAALRLAVLCDIASHFATTCRMTDMDRISQVEMLDHCRGVGLIVIHVVASGHLRGATVTAPVMRNDAIAVGKKEEHLRVPVVRRQWPAVVKH